MTKTKWYAKPLCHCERSVAILIALALVLSLAVVAVPMAGTVEADGDVPTIDGVLSSGEWDDHYLGTSVTGWSGGMSVAVYGFADDTYLYAAYVADTSQPGWSTACGLCVNCNLYYYTTKDTLLNMWAWGEPYQVQQTEDWSSWDNLGTLGDVGIEYWYMDMYTHPNPGIAELRIPLSLLGTEGVDQIELYGQYWQYDWAELFYVNLPPPPVIEVDIDIKPGSDPNSINLKSKGVVPVAVLTTDGFDASTVDPETVGFLATKNYGDVTLSGGFQSGNFPEIWDLTACDLVLSFTYDANGLVDDFGGDAHAWAELGVRQVGYGNFNPTWDVEGAGVWLATDYDWNVDTFDPDPPGSPTQDLDDKLILQKAGGHGEGDYNLPSTPPNPWANHRVWWDRDGVDPWQNDETANTDGIYNIEITLHLTSPTSGEAYMTINGLNQGFETDGNWSTIELTPAGMTFTGDMSQMQVFYGLYGYGATHGVAFEDITATGRLAGAVRWTMEDVDGDGDLDLLLHFKTEQLGLNEESTGATLTGATYGGQPIQGTDTVNIVPKGKGKK